jgi:hypothetical protein
MAQEISINLRMRVNKGFLIHEDSVTNQLVDMTGSVAAGGVQNVGTNPEVIVVNDVATAGYSFFRNTGATNFVELGTGTGTSFVAFAKLKAGETSCLRLGTNAPTARANVAAINLQYYIVSD